MEELRGGGRQRGLPGLRGEARGRAGELRAAGEHGEERKALGAKGLPREPRKGSL